MKDRFYIKIFQLLYQWVYTGLIKKPKKIIKSFSEGLFIKYEFSENYVNGCIHEWYNKAKTHNFWFFSMNDRFHINNSEHSCQRLYTGMTNRSNWKVLNFSLEKSF